MSNLSPGSYSAQAMIDVLLTAAQIMVVALAAYNLATAVPGWRQPPAVATGRRERRFRVVVPAHNEERVIGSLLEDLERQAYPRSLYRVSVLADNSTDQTARIARRTGVEVVERSTGPAGKGPALDWLLARQPLVDEALVVLDADNRVPENLLAVFADQLDAGHDALQAYLDVSNPDRSLLTTASALSYWSSNRMVQLARTNLGWPADLGGTGMCIGQAAVEAAGGFGGSLAEDQAMGVTLFEQGIPVVWIHDLRIRDEKPARPSVAIRQKARWARGRRTVARQHTTRLLRMRTPAAFDLVLRLNQPSRMGMALLAVVLAGGAAAGLPLWRWQVWSVVAGIQFLAPLPFLVRDGVPSKYLVRYPAMVLLPLLKGVARLTRDRGWYHTPHQGGS